MKKYSCDLQNIKSKNLTTDERVYYRDLLRKARYAALADSEGFLMICFALESLGLRLCGKMASLGEYEYYFQKITENSIVLNELTTIFPSIFTNFDALFEFVRMARNDLMHTGAYARHVTSAAIELCIGIEEALIEDKNLKRYLVKDYMVKSPVTVQPWEPVAHARQLMLTHSFSYLPIDIGGWKLVSDASLAKYLQLSRKHKNLPKSLAASITEAQDQGLELITAHLIKLDDNAQDLLIKYSDVQGGEPRLWLVVDEHKLCGVLSPFELI